MTSGIKTNAAFFDVMDKDRTFNTLACADRLRSSFEMLLRAQQEQVLLGLHRQYIACRTKEMAMHCIKNMNSTGSRGGLSALALLRQEMAQVEALYVTEMEVLLALKHALNKVVSIQINTFMAMEKVVDK